MRKKSWRGSKRRREGMSRGRRSSNEEEEKTSHKIPESHHLPCRRGAEKPAGWIDGWMDAKMNGWMM